LEDLDIDDSQEIQRVCKGLHQSLQFNITYFEPYVSLSTLSHPVYILILSLHLVLDTDVVF
jgi:hypothetical protein